MSVAWCFGQGLLPPVLVHCKNGARAEKDEAAHDGKESHGRSAENADGQLNRHREQANARGRQQDNGRVIAAQPPEQEVSG